MTQYIDIDEFIRIIQKESEDLSDAQLAIWVNGKNFRDSLLLRASEEDDVGTESQLVNEKLSYLNDLIEMVESFETELRDVQMSQFKQLENLRRATFFLNRAENYLTHEDQAEINVTETVKTCAYTKCGKVFVSNVPSKLYCSEKCRENAKKWRKRHVHDG